MQEILQQGINIGENAKTILNSKLSSAISTTGSMDFGEIFANASKKQTELMEASNKTTQKVQNSTDTINTKNTDNKIQNKQNTKKEVRNKKEDAKEISREENTEKNNIENTEETAKTNECKINLSKEEVIDNALLNTDNDENSTIQTLANKNNEAQFSLNLTKTDLNISDENIESETATGENEVETAEVDIADINENNKINISKNNTDNRNLEMMKNIQNTKNCENTKSPLLVDENNIHIDENLKNTILDNAGEVDIQNIVENEILEELNLDIENITVSETPQNVTFVQDASEQMFKMSLEKSANMGVKGIANLQSGQSSNSPLQGQANQNSNTNFQTADKSFQTKFENLRDIKLTDKNAKFAEIQKNDILNQIGAKFEQLKDGVTSKITLSLRPENLGRVVIEMSHDKNGVTTNILAQNQDVKEILEKNIGTLKEQLTQAGVNVDNISIKAPEGNGNSNFLANENSRENLSQQNQGFEERNNSNDSQKGRKERETDNKNNFSELSYEDSPSKEETYQGIKVGKNVYNI